MRVAVVRSGGFAGISRKATVDATSLSPADQSAIELLVSAALASGPSNERPHADGFQYQVTIRRDRKSHRLNASETAVASPVVALATFVLSRATS